MITWSNPEELSAYRSSLRQPGIYIIGGAKDVQLQVEGSGKDDPYLARNWPDNFVPHYIGISESKNIGVRGRLRSHRRGKGNKGIATRLRKSEKIYFIAAYGVDLVAFESLFLCLKSTSQFADNVRGEVERDSNRKFRQVRSSMSKAERDHYDNLDFDGRGL